MALLLRFCGHAYPWVFILLVHLSQADGYVPNRSSSPVRMGYWPAYAAHKYPASLINARLYTHLAYAFARLDKTTFELLPPLYDTGQFHMFSGIVHAQNPRIKTFVSIGGGGSSWRDFSDMVSSNDTRFAFIQSSIALARAAKFDGLDLDWEFPHSVSDMTHLGILFSEWKQSCEVEAAESGRPPLLLTAAVYYASTVEYGGKGTYPISSIAQNLDWVNLMCFDYYGSWEPHRTGVHTALYDTRSHINTNHGLGTWLRAGLPPQKAVVGLAAYGYSWQLESASVHGIGVPAIGPSPDNPTPTFSSIVDFILHKHATVVYDRSTVTTYCFSDRTWIGFDDPISIFMKVRYLKRKNLRGYFFWTASYDEHSALAIAALIALKLLTEGKSSKLYDGLQEYVRNPSLCSPLWCE